MEPTVDQALQEGIAAHKEGKFQDAERLYRAILEAQPSHPDANHNLGGLAVAVGKPLEAIPLFKRALEANPKIEQFWLSYIDALMRLERFDEAQRVLVEGEKSGVSSDKLDALNQRLLGSVPNDTPKTAKGQTLSEKRKKLAEKKKSKKRKAQGSSSSAGPSQDQLNHLLGHYQSARLVEAEALAISLTQLFPKHPYGWKVLGAVFKKMGRLSESLAPKQKAAELSPQDAEAHSNLGNTLQVLGRLDKAEASCRQAIAMKPDYAEAHYNLGNTLKELGRLDEAEASYKQAIALKPDYAKAHDNLGITLKEQGRLDEAETSFRQAIAMKPDYAAAHSNLAGNLKELGRWDEAEASYRQAIALKPDYAEAHSNLGVLFFESRRYDQAIKHLELSDTHLSKLYAIRCSYLQDEASIFYEKYDLLVSQGEINAVIGSLGIRSALQYGTKKANPFCNEPLNYVVHTDLRKQYDFEKIFVQTARNVLADSSVSYKAQGHLTNGLQTAGNIFVQGGVSKTEIEDIIRAEIEKYRINFKDSDEGLIKKWPTSYDIQGWLVCMQSGGKLDPHMHENGWISGSIYINVPPKSKADSGNLVLCLSDRDNVQGTGKSHQSSVDVVTGALCLFPSSLHHYTIPFDEKEERIVLAFDVVPKEVPSNPATQILE